MGIDPSYPEAGIGCNAAVAAKPYIDSGITGALVSGGNVGQVLNTSNATPVRGNTFSLEDLGPAASSGLTERIDEPGEYVDIVVRSAHDPWLQYVKLKAAGMPVADSPGSRSAKVAVSVAELGGVTIPTLPTLPTLPSTPSAADLLLLPAPEWMSYDKIIIGIALCSVGLVLVICCLCCAAVLIISKRAHSRIMPAAEADDAEKAAGKAYYLADDAPAQASVRAPAPATPAMTIDGGDTTKWATPSRKGTP